ncbi:MAG: hypothetical protein K9L17_08160 [Clostridiales bacterium]|nr:hypothetical protein [Clostridiales bacterium]MCF8022648.1 hypothetical protein [Clostridiales bacterium]
MQKNFSKKFFTPGKIKELSDDISLQGAKKGLQKFAEKYNLAPGGLRSYYYSSIRDPHPKSPDQALLDLFSEKGTLIQQDIESVSQKTGTGCGTVLKKWGSIVKKKCSSPWKKGEMIASLLDTGARLKSVASSLGLKNCEARRYAYTFKMFPPDSRFFDLSFRHHMNAAETETPEEWLNIAQKYAWTSRELKKVIDEQGELFLYKEKIDSTIEENKKLKKKLARQKFIENSIGWKRKDIDQMVRDIKEATGYSASKAEKIFFDLRASIEWSAAVNTIASYKNKVENYKKKAERAEVAKKQLQMLLASIRDDLKKAE